MLREKSYLFLAVIFWLAFIFSGCDNIYRLLHKEGAQEKELIGEATVYEPQPKVEVIQKLLKIHGYRVGEPDGKLGPLTREAVAKFQKDHALPESRFVDTATWQALDIFSKSGLVIDGEIQNKVIQEALKNAGFDPGAIDGVIGPKTDRQIRAFQAAHDLKVDGKIGARTLTTLERYVR